MPTSLLRRALMPALTATTLVASSLLLAVPAGASDEPAPAESQAHASPSPTSEVEASPAAQPQPEPEPEPEPEPTDVDPSPAEPAPTVSPDGTPSAAPEPVPAPATTPPAPQPTSARVLTMSSAVVAADDAVVDAAASWLASKLSEAGTVTGSFPDGSGGTIEFTDWGRSLDSALALLAAGNQDGVLGRTLTSVEDPAAVAEYTQGSPFDAEDAAYVGGTAKLALVTELTGGDATDVGGVDLLAQLESLVQDSGRLADRSDYGSYANLYGHAFTLLALDSAGRAPETALVEALLNTQCPDGSFPQDYEPSGAGCEGQVDATGLVLQALGALDLASGDAAQDAAQWLLEQQQEDGGFPGEAPVNSAGYAVLGLNAVDQPTGAAVAWLAAQQNTDGGLGRGAGEDTSSDLFATAQALPALVGTTFQRSARSVVRGTQQTPGPGNGAPTPTPAGPTTSPVPTTSAIAAASTPVAPAAVSGSALPRTGSDLSSLLLAGGLLLGFGGVLTAAACTHRRGRSATAS